jgi:hypothetical protein
MEIQPPHLHRIKYGRGYGREYGREYGRGYGREYRREYGMEYGEVEWCEENGVKQNGVKLTDCTQI